MSVPLFDKDCEVDFVIHDDICLVVVDLIETQDVIVSPILDPSTQERQDISVSTEPSMGEL